MFDNVKVSKILSEFTEIEAAYLFGSAASGRLRSRSDIDVALLLRPGVEKTRQLEIRLKLMAGLEDVFRRPTEVVIINDVSLLLFSEIMKAKKLIYEKDPAYRIRFESQKRKEYLDFRPHMIRHSLAFRKRLMEG